MSAWATPDDKLDAELDTLADEQLSDAEKRAKVNKAIVELAQNGNSERLHEIIGNEALKPFIDLNGKDAAGSTALIYASCYGHESTVSELLRYGADPDLQDQNEWTALMWAINNQHLSIVQRLMENGADIAIQTGTGRTAADFCSPSSLIYSYLSSNGYIKSTAALDFYHGAEDPAEFEQQFAKNVEESTQALGLDVARLAVDENANVPGFGSMVDESVPEFYWGRYTYEQSLPLTSTNIPKFLDMVVSDVKPTLSKKEEPVSANCLFLAWRYLHHQSTDDQVLSLLYPIVRRITFVVDENAKDLTYLCYWLANASILDYYLMRDDFANDGTEQAVHLSIRELIVSLTFKVIFNVEDLLDELIGRCLLDFSNIPGIDTIEFRSDWRIFHRKKNAPDAAAAAKLGILPPSMESKRRPAPTKVTAILSSLLLVLDIYSVHPVVIQEIYSQLFYWMGATMFNTIMGNKKYLSRSRAMQIRLNISNIEDWCRTNNRRPDDGNEFSKSSRYKSMVELCRIHFGSLTEILQWLQCFSGFGSDFTNVVAAMQELNHLNPKQLLYAAKKYRSEVNEPELSKDYRKYLDELAKHWEEEQARKAKRAAAKAEEKAAADRAAEAAADAAAAKAADLAAKAEAARSDAAAKIEAATTKATEVAESAQAAAQAAAQTAAKKVAVAALTQKTSLLGAVKTAAAEQQSQPTDAAPKTTDQPLVDTSDAKSAQPEPTPEAQPPKSESGPAPTPAPAPEAAPAGAPVATPAELEPLDMSILAAFPAVTSKDVLMDDGEPLPFRLPSLREMIIFWGGGLGGANTGSPHYMVPQQSVEIVDELDNSIEPSGEAYLPAPAVSHHRQWGDEDLDITNEEEPKEEDDDHYLNGNVWG